MENATITTLTAQFPLVEDLIALKGILDDMELWRKDCRMSG